YDPLDVSEAALLDSGAHLQERYPDLTVHAVVTDFEERLAIPESEGPRLVAFLGGTIGNLLPEERSVFLARVRAGLRTGEWLLLGTDLVKDPATLVAAYDDAAGVTAEFNKNVLTVVDRELDADFDPDDFEHVALWDAEAEWIEMRLRARRSLLVRLKELDLTVSFDAGEELRTEISAKFRREGVEAELAAAGFALRQWWTDAEGRFGLSLAEGI
ncbi:MAG: L-histidine N(alpha)-methyltransferase, partial [Catenulispora sp.]|nr:L-histidine N(alpha)-methyltransferase [Catenulispora sp.]